MPVDQVQTLSFGESGGMLVNGGEQDNRLLHHLNISTNTSVIAKINTSNVAQVKEVRLYQRKSFSCDGIYRFIFLCHLTS